MLGQAVRVRSLLSELVRPAVETGLPFHRRLERLSVLLMATEEWL